MNAAGITEPPADPAPGAPAGGDGPFRLLFERSPCATCVFDTETFVCQSANDAALALYGYAREQFLSLRLADLHPPGAAVEIYDQYRSAAGAPDSALPLRQVWRHVRRDGTEFDAEVQADLVPFRERQAWLLTTRDVTGEISARQRSEEFVREGHRLLSTVIEGTRDAIFMRDMEGRYIMANSAAGEALGMPVQAIIGKTNEELFPPDVARLFAEQDRQILESGQSQVFETRIWLGATARTYLVEKGIYHDHQGNVIGLFGIARDITERKRAEEVLQESEAKFRTLAETVAAAAFIFQDTELLYVNPSAAAITGYSREELMGMKFWDVIDPEFRDLVRQRGLARQQGADVPPRYEVKIRTKTGESRWVEFTAGIIEFQGRRAVLGTAFDITERKRAEEALLDSEAKQRAVLNAIPDSILRFKVKGPLINFKPATGLSAPAAYSGVSSIARRLIRSARKAVESGGTEIIEYRASVNGVWRDYEARIVASSPGEAVAILRDVSDHKQMEKQVLEISDREQRHIGQNIHDGLCQHLTGTAFAAKVLLDKLAAKGHAEARSAKRLAGLIEEGIRHARDLARELYPVQLEQGGLGPALQQLASNVESLFRVRCVCECARGVEVRDRNMSAHLYRIAQEAISNGIQHGKAKHVNISLSRSHGLLHLTVKDDGVGLPRKPKRAGGMGLTIMQYRAKMIGATVTIRRASKGTLVTCSFAAPSDPHRKGKPQREEKVRPRQSR